MVRDHDTPAEADTLVEVMRRAPILHVLHAHGPLERAELEERLRVSRSTSHRSTRALLDLGLIRSKGGRFSLTVAGDAVARETERFRADVGHALLMAPVHEVAEGIGAPLDPEALTDAVTTPADRGDGFQPVRRFLELIETTDTLRGIDVIAIAPLYLEEAFGRVLEGMQTEEIAVPAAVEDVLRGDPERCHEACASGNLKIRIHETLPCSIMLTDDRVAIGVREPGSRRLSFMVDTAEGAALHWAEDVYARYRAQAVPLDQFSFACYQEAMVAIRSRRP